MELNLQGFGVCMCMYACACALVHVCARACVCVCLVSGSQMARGLAGAAAGSELR